MLLKNLIKNGIILLDLEEVFMLNYDYAINVYYGEKYICSLVAKYAGGYDNVIWWQLDKLIKEYQDSKVSKELFETTIDTVTEYFHYVSEDLSKIEDFKIDFLNKTVSLPTHPIYSYEEFENCWGDVLKFINEDGKDYIIYEETHKYPLRHVEFDEEILMKEIVTFDEFKMIEEFYSRLMDDDQEFILNGNKILKFNMI